MPDPTGVKFKIGDEIWVVTGPTEWPGNYWNIETEDGRKRSCRLESHLLELILRDATEHVSVAAPEAR